MSGSGHERAEIVPLNIAQPGKPFSPFALPQLQRVLADKALWPLAKTPYSPNPEFESGDSYRIEAEMHRRLNESGPTEPLRAENLGQWQKLLVSWQVGKLTIQLGLVYEAPENLADINDAHPDSLLRLFPIGVSAGQEHTEEKQLFLVMQLFSREKNVAFDIALQPEPEGQVFRGRVQTNKLGDMVDVDLADGGDNVINHILLVPADAQRLAGMQVTISPPEDGADPAAAAMN